MPVNVDGRCSLCAVEMSMTNPFPRIRRPKCIAPRQPAHLCNFILMASLLNLQRVYKTSAPNEIKLSDPNTPLYRNNIPGPILRS